MRNHRGAVLSILLCAGVSGAALGFAGEDILDGNPWHHEDITERGLAGDRGRGDARRYEGAGFSQQAADAIAWHADYIDSYLYNPLFWLEDARGSGGRRLRAALVGYENLAKLHFDDTFTTAGVRRTWERYASGTLIGLDWAARNNNVAAAHHILGVSFHAVQDFYSHSSWVSEPDRRCMTWLQTPVDERTAAPLYTGAYELPESGAPQHHGAYSLSCSILRGDDMDGVMSTMCGVASPLQNAPFCTAFRMCRPAEGVAVSVNEDVYPGVAYLEPPGIALDNTWLARVQAPVRGLIEDGRGFASGMDGMHFRPEDCREIVGADAANVCSFDADQVFAGAKDLATRATTEWAEYLEQAMTAMGHAGFWSKVKTQGSGDRQRADQFEDFALLPYQFLAAGPYPVGNPAAADREASASAAGWYLRIRLRTSRTLGAGTDADVYARVRAGGQERDILLDYLPTDDSAARVNNRLLVYNDFETGADDVYTIGPFAEQPESVTLVNDSGSSGETLAALWNDVVAGAESFATSLRRGLITFAAGGADHVGTASRYYTGAELIEQIGDPQSRFSYFEDTLRVDGAEQGVHELTYRVRAMPWLLTDQEREDGWAAVEVQARRFKTVRESSVDRFSGSDEPFFLFHMAPLNGRSDPSGTYGSPPMRGMDDGDEVGVPRRTGSSHVMKIPPVGGLVLSARVFESDSENAYDREQLRREFASGLDEAAREAAPEFLDELGRLIAADWQVDQVQIEAFERGPAPRAGEVVRTRSVGRIKGDAASSPIMLDWANVKSLATPDFAIDAWQAGPVDARVLDGKWHAEGYECETPVPYDAVDVAVDGAALTATKLDGDPCVPRDEVSWRGRFENGVITGELYMGEPPAKPEGGEAERPADALPDFLDPAVDPLIGLEGNWIITWEDSGLPPAYATVTKGGTYGCLDEADGGCWYGWRRDPAAGWEVSFMYPPDEITSGALEVSPDGAIAAEWAYFHLGWWGGRSSLNAQGEDAVSGRWEYDDENQGAEIWRRVRSRVREVESLTPESAARKPVGDPVTLTAEYLQSPFDLRGNRPNISLRLYGDEMWGAHYRWLPRESDLEIDALHYICTVTREGQYDMHSSDKVCLTQGGVLGVQIDLNVWHDAREGLHTLYFDGMEIPFILELAGKPEEAPPGWRPMTLEMASCAVLREIDPPQDARPMTFHRADFRRQ